MKIYSRKSLTDKVLTFREKNKRWPSVADVDQSRLGVSRAPIYREFGNLKGAIDFAKKYLKGEVELTQSEKEGSKIGEFQCPICGGWASGVEEFYSSLARILSMRFGNRLRCTNDPVQIEVIFNCIYDVFGKHNSIMNGELARLGYLEAYQKSEEITIRDYPKSQGVSARRGSGC